MAENRGTRDDLPPEGGVDEVRYEVASAEVHVKPANPDDDLDYTGEGGDGQTERVGNGYQS